MSQADWGAIHASVRDGLSARNICLEPVELIYVTRFIVEALEDRKLAIVPRIPDSKMVTASQAAMDKYVRPAERWLSTKAKHKWRLICAIDARPPWRDGYATALVSKSAPTVNTSPAPTLIQMPAP